jgi:polar amino acid transport system substrate-binding protein
MFPAKLKKSYYLPVVIIILAILLSQCAPAPATSAPAAPAGPTPEATGLAPYTPPSEGLVAEIQKRGVIRNGVECQNPPGEFYDPGSKECKGYSIDLAKKLADKLGVKLEVIDTAWSGVIPSLYTKNFDLVWSSMTITDARKKAVEFSKPYGCDQVTWIVKKGDKSITKPEDLNGKTVATQLNSAAELQAQDLEKTANIKYKELKSFDHFDGAYLSITTGQADIATSTAWNNIPLFKAQPDAFDVAFTLPIYNFVGVAIRKQDSDLSKVVNDLLTELEASGEMANLQYKYYGYAFACGEQGPNAPANWVAPK